MSSAGAKADPHGIDWQRWQPTMRATLLFALRGDEVLLIHKKRGLGAGKVNAPGGKIDPGESAAEAAVREVQEEVRIDVREAQEMGVLRFQFVDADRLALHCTVFTATEFAGEPCETEEALPFWCAKREVPYAEMWADDKYWLPGMLEGRRFDADFVFDDELLLWREIRWREHP